MSEEPELESEESYCDEPGCSNTVKTGYRFCEYHQNRPQLKKEKTESPLEQAKQSMGWKEGWRNKANDEADEEMHGHQVEMETLCRSDAIAYAAIAQAEQLKRQADALEAIADFFGGYNIDDMLQWLKRNR